MIIPEFFGNVAHRLVRLLHGGHGMKAKLRKRGSLLVAVGVLLGCTLIGRFSFSDENTVSEIVGELRTARSRITTDDSVENRVLLATWRLLLAEVATQEGANLALWSLASDEFSQGKEELQAIEDQIKTDPAIERQLSRSPAVAMRLDAARIRQADIGKREELARTQERERLNQLRVMVRSYRELTEKMGLADYQVRMGNFDLARQASLEALEAMNKVYEVVRQRSDYYLFDDEPVAEGEGELQVVRTAPSPFNVELIAQLKALQALATWKIAAQDGEKPDQKLLAQAQAWANASLTGEAVTDVSLPEGHDPNNPLGHYVLAVVNEAIGLEVASENPADAEVFAKAKPFFENASKSLEQAVSLLKGQSIDDKHVAELLKDIGTRRSRLASPDCDLQSSADLVAKGQPEGAWRLLRETRLRHRTQPVWLALIDAGRQAQAEMGELEAVTKSAFDGGVFRADDLPAQVVTAKVILEAVWKQMTVGDVGGMSEETTTRLVEQLQRQQEVLAGLIPQIKEELDKAEAEAVVSILIAYRAMLSPGTTDVSAAFQESHRRAKDAALTLEAALEKETDAFKQVRLREALIVARLAYGHAAVSVLPNYRDDGLLAFAAAYDEMARLPFRRENLKFLGSPLIRALANRPDEAGVKLAQEERRYRQMVTQFIEGTYALHFGDPASASARMAAAMTKANPDDGDSSPASPRDAAEMLGQADGFDAAVSLQESLRAFKVLADVAAGDPETAVHNAVTLVDDSLTPVDLQQADWTAIGSAVPKIESPLVGYALISSLEAYAKSIPSPTDPRRQALLRLVSLTLDRVTVLLGSQSMQLRYPYLVTLAQEAKQRLGSADEHLAKSRQQRLRGDLEGAIATLSDGLRLHPDCQPLWQMLLEAEIERARRVAGSEPDYASILERVTEASQAGMISQYLANYYRAAVLEKTGKQRDSLEAYQAALEVAKTSQERVRAQAKVSELRLRFAMSRG